MLDSEDAGSPQSMPEHLSTILPTGVVAATFADEEFGLPTWRSGIKARASCTAASAYSISDRPGTFSGSGMRVLPQALEPAPQDPAPQDVDPAPQDVDPASQDVDPSLHSLQ